MRYLYFVKQDNVLKLSGVSDYRTFSDQGAATDECTVAHLGVFADDDRSVQIGAVKYLRCLMNPDVFTAFLIFCRIQAVSQFDDKITETCQCLPRVCKLFQIIRRQRMG